MKSNPRVSVILTSYNHAKFIKESIESVLNQSFQDFELIIWDDCSTDNSWDIILSFDDPRIHPFRNETNLSGGVIRKAIEEVVEGDYIAIHHSDDIWESSKLEKQVNFLDNNQNYEAVFTLVNIIDEAGEIYTNKDHLYSQIFDQPNRSRHEWLRYFFFNGNALCMPSVMFHKSIYMKVDACLGLYQLPDFSLWVQFCLFGEIFILQEKLVGFRIREDAENWSGDRTDTRIRTQFETLKIFDHYKKLPSINDLLRTFPQAERYINENNADLLFALGMTVIESGNSAQHRLFGLNLLYEAFNDPLRSNKLKIYQGFDKKDFIELTGKHDIFSLEYIRNLKIAIQEIRQEVLFYALSRSWRITKPLRKFMSKIRKIINTS